jgi:transposase-like protein
MRKKKTYSAAQKFNAAITLIKGEKSAVEIAKDVGCHPTIVADWRNEVEHHGPLIFERQVAEGAKDTKIAVLERTLGKLAVQNDFLGQVLERSG